MEHVPPELFGEDYLYFYEGVLTDELSDTQAERTWRLLGLADGVFLERARADAAERGLDVEYLQGDMRTLPWEARFDLVLNWFTSFGYFDDTENRAWLREAGKVLREGGRLVLDVHNRDAFARNLLPATTSERGDDLVVDRHRFDLMTGRAETDRLLVRDGNVRSVRFSVRFFTFTELRDWLLEAGFSTVEVSGHEGEPLDLQVRRMLVVATR